ncbi:Uncharacterised protein [Mycobacteroides abscessus subsp. massiliense]|nr:Uncharacterised protein [Mycobacteroides abscessus subsp. massiliense]
MGQEPIDFFGADAVFGGDLGEGFFHCIADDVFVQQFDVLLDRHQAVAVAVIGVGVFPAFKYSSFLWSVSLWNTSPRMTAEAFSEATETACACSPVRTAL